MKSYWCKIDLSLPEVANLVTEPLGLTDCEFEYENIYEWIGATDASNNAWNISRKHDGDGRSSFTEFLIIAPSQFPLDAETVGQQLADALRCAISLGDGGFSGDDHWVFSEKHRFLPTK